MAARIPAGMLAALASQIRLICMPLLLEDTRRFGHARETIVNRRNASTMITAILRNQFKMIPLTLTLG
jgi:hypothetical protein